jgi:negative modulator of initiation of replication
MKTIQIEDDVHNFLLRNVTVLGEDASSILRRLLKLSQQNFTQPSSGAGPVEQCLRHERFLRERDAVGKFLFILSWLYKHQKTEFPKILGIRGRSRAYFGESAAELDKTGNSVNPQAIPDSPYWVVTNNDTPKKRRILDDVMRVLGYVQEDRIKMTEGIQ